MRNMVLSVAALAALLISAEAASACRGGHGHGHCGGCGSGGCGYGGGGCGSGGCGYGGGGCGSGGCGYGGGGCGSGGCSTCGVTTHSTGYGYVHVTLPKDAKLTINGVKTTSKSSKRRFQTATIKKGKKYHYTFTAYIKRDGKLHKFTRKVRVRAGKTTRVDLNDTKQYVSAE
jgi:uncharacterized protein (TIGR03000 family)